MNEKIIEKCSILKNNCLKDYIENKPVIKGNENMFKCIYCKQYTCIQNGDGLLIKQISLRCLNCGRTQLQLLK